MARIQGELVAAQLENSASDLTPTSTGRIYFNTTTGPKWYNSVAWRTAADLESAQTFSGQKTLASPLVTTAITLNAQAETRYADSDSSNYVAFKGPATVTSNVVWTLPSTDSTGSQVLQSNGSGTLSWASAATDPMTTRGDMIYRDSGNSTARLPVGAAEQVVSSDGTDVSWQYPDLANIRGSEGAGTTTLTIADKRRQVFNLSAARTCRLPTTSVPAGYVLEVENRGDFLLTFESSDTTVFTLANAGAGSVGLASIYRGRVRFKALQATPTAPSHWLVDYVEDQGSFSFTLAFSVDNGTASIAAQTNHWKRLGRNVTILTNIGGLAKGTATGNFLLSGLPFNSGFDFYGQVAQEQITFPANRIQFIVRANSGTDDLSFHFGASNGNSITTCGAGDITGSASIWINMSYSM